MEMLIEKHIFFLPNKVLKILDCIQIGDRHDEVGLGLSFSVNQILEKN